MKTDGVLGNVQPDGAGISRILSPPRFRRVKLAAGPGIDRRTMIFHRLLAAVFQLLRGAEAVVRLAFRDQTPGMLEIDGELVALAIRRKWTADIGTLVPVEPQPLQVFQQLPLVAALTALDVRVLDAQDHCAALLPGDKPVEQRGARVANVYLSGW